MMKKLKQVLHAVATSAAFVRAGLTARAQGGASGAEKNAGGETLDGSTKLLRQWLGVEAMFAFGNALAWMLVAMCYPLLTQVAPSLRGAIFSASVIIGNPALYALAFFVLLALFRPLPLLVRNVVGVALASVATAILLIDFRVYDLYKQHLDFAFVQMFFSPAGSEVFTFSSLMWAVAIAVFIAIIFAETFLLRFSKKMVGKRVSRCVLRFGVAFGVFSCLAFNLLYAHAAFTGHLPVLLRAESFPGLHPLSARGLMRKLGFKQTAQQEFSHGGGVLAYPLAPLTLRPENKTPPPNILFLFVDSWRWDALTPEAMPRLFAKTKNAQVFQNHVSGGNATRCGLFSAFYSLPATYWHSFFAARRRPVFMETLEKKNYDFAVFASANLQNPEFDQTIFAGIRNLRLSSRGKDTISRDADAEKDFLQFLQQREKNRPWFGFLFYDALHAYALPPSPAMPFQPSEESINYLSLANDTPRLPMLNLYKNSTFNLDIVIGNLLDTLEKRGDLENTIVVITGDHGQEVNETKTNTWGHNSNYTNWQIAVPFVVLWPGKSPNTFTHRTTHWDLVPTLLGEVFACENPVSDYSSGKNLYDTSSRDGFIMASYSSMAMLYGGSAVQTFKKYGMGARYYLDDYFREPDPIPPAVLRDALTEMRRFRATK